MRAAEKTFVTRELELQLRDGARITPSNIDPWFGLWVGDDDFTQEQLSALARIAADPGSVERQEVHLRVTAAQIWLPLGTAYPWRRIVCPVVGHRLERRMVVAPAGLRKLVYPDGALRRPFRKGSWQ